MEWGILFSTFGLTFVAELGDKTQLAVVAQTCKYRRPWAVFLGASLALTAVTLLGANGSGKSTSLNNISGFVPSLSGKVMFEGKAITNLKAHEIFRQGIVQVSQARDLFPDLTVEHNLRLGAVVRNRSGVEEQMEEQEMNTCRHCAKKKTTGSQREPDWPWRWPGVPAPWQ